MNIRGISREAITLIKHFEGLHKIDTATGLVYPYRDSVGYWTIGYGHLLSRDRKLTLDDFPFYREGLTYESCEEILKQDLESTAIGVLDLIEVPLTDGQYGALVSFAFNLGLGNLKVSTLKTKVNEKLHFEASKEFNKWVFAGGIKLNGLVKRRKAESELYLS